MSKRHFTDYDQPAAPEVFDANHFGGSVGQFFQMSQEKLVMNMISPDNASILDVGTGTGRLAIPLASRGAEVIGLDASEEMLRRAEEKAGGLSNLAFELGDARQLRFAAGSFDYVVSFRTLMHFDDWQTVISEMCRVSRRCIVFDAPPTNGVALLEACFDRLRHALGSSVQPYRTFRLSELKRELHRHGYEPLVIEKQFVLPLKLHRLIGSARFTRTAEAILRRLGLTRLLGAPILIKAARKA